MKRLILLFSLLLLGASFPKPQGFVNDFAGVISYNTQTVIHASAYELQQKSGAQLATICPTFEQLTQTVFTLQDKGFINIDSVEILLRRILVRRGKTRPEQRMPSHTGWLVFATKTEQKVIRDKD